MVTLNIGLQLSEHVSKAPSIKMAARDVVDAGAVETLLHAVYGANNVRTRLTMSNTEPTLVVRITGVAVPHDTVSALCHMLGQDCIALQWQDTETGCKRGHLLGPRAEQWGEFNADYFIEW